MFSRPMDLLCCPTSLGRLFDIALPNLVMKKEKAMELTFPLAKRQVLLPFLAWCLTQESADCSTDYREKLDLLYLYITGMALALAVLSADSTKLGILELCFP